MYTASRTDAAYSMFFLRSTTFTSPLSSCFTRHLNLQENNSHSFNVRKFRKALMLFFDIPLSVTEIVHIFTSFIQPHIGIIFFHLWNANRDVQSLAPNPKSPSIFIKKSSSERKSYGFGMTRGCVMMIKILIVVWIFLWIPTMNTHKEISVRDTGERNLFYKTNEMDKWDRHCQFYTHRKTKSVKHRK